MTLIEPVGINKPEASNSPAIAEDESQADSPKPSVEKRQSSYWAIFSSTFLTIFFAEMGDKTQLATLLISAESQSPWIVFAGAATALITTSLLGVAIGYWLARRLSPEILDLVVALLLLLISGLLLGDVVCS